MIDYLGHLLIAGTHWGFEIISMLLMGKAETIPIPKVFTMLEATPQENLDALPSPRVLNSHFPISILPKQMKGNLNYFEDHFLTIGSIFIY